MTLFGPVCQVETPDCVVVVGDGNPTLSRTIAAKKLHYSVAHVETGLRSGADKCRKIQIV